MWIWEHMCVHLEIACILFWFWQIFHSNLQPEQKKKKRKNVWIVLLLMHAFSTINSPNFKQNSHLLYVKSIHLSWFTVQLQSCLALWFFVLFCFVSLLCFVFLNYFILQLKAPAVGLKSPAISFWLLFYVFLASVSQRCLREATPKKLLF